LRANAEQPDEDVGFHLHTSGDGEAGLDGATPKAVEARIHRARDKLRAKLGPVFGKV
jgi:hypothetical protein